MQRFFIGERKIGLYFPDEEIVKIISGKVKHKRFYFESEWLDYIKKGIPLPFFKHISYKDEQEYRLIIQKISPEAGEKITHIYLLAHLILISLKLYFILAPQLKMQKFLKIFQPFPLN